MADSSYPRRRGGLLSMQLELSLKERRAFHVLGSIRRELELPAELFSLHGTLLRADAQALGRLSAWLSRGPSDPVGTAELLQALAVHELLHLFVHGLRQQGQLDLASLAADLGAAERHAEPVSLLARFRELFPPGSGQGSLPPAAALEELLLVYLHNRNPAFSRVRPLLDDTQLQGSPAYQRLDTLFGGVYSGVPPQGAAPGLLAALKLLLAPQLAAPADLQAQLSRLLAQLEQQGEVPQSVLRTVLLATDLLAEQQRPPAGGPPAPPRGGIPEERGELLPLAAAARSSSEQPWMRDTVISAKNCLVWLSQLSSRYGTELRSLDAIPDAELQQLKDSGVTALWLIGIWQRSEASRRIKQLRGQPDAAASAYSIFDYVISSELGGEEALDRLRQRAAQHGLKLVADMVPNHTALDSRWVLEHPERFLQLDAPPQPDYSFDGPELSADPALSIRLEDHYWDGSDAAVVFRRSDTATGNSRYIYHGNDGTGLPWNDTAQLDYRNPATREAVLQQMVAVARRFQLIRFDAAMTLVSRHIQRLWYPPPGAGGAIFSRALHGSLPSAELARELPGEFWSEAVSRLQAEVPGTMLIAEAFWMLEEYFVQNLGLHRVYNSAFMHMIRDGDNAGFRTQLRRALTSDPTLLSRFVNFLSNPDEDSAASQFGTDDRYFAACTLLVTLPGLPLFGHGQFEGLSEKYGMEFRAPRLAEQPLESVLKRHAAEISPLLLNRQLFSGTAQFELYDFQGAAGTVEDVVAFSNASGSEPVLVVVNNSGQAHGGRLHRSVPRLREDGRLSGRGLLEALGITAGQASHLSWRIEPGGAEQFSPLEQVARAGLSFELGPYGTRVLSGFRCHRQDDSLRFDLLDPRQVYPDVRLAAARAAWQPLRSWLLALPGSAGEAAPFPAGQAPADSPERFIRDRARRLNALTGQGPLKGAWAALSADQRIWLLLQGLAGADELLPLLTDSLPGLLTGLPWRPGADWWRSEQLQAELQVHEAAGLDWFRAEAWDALAAAFALRGALRAGAGAGTELWLALQEAQDFSGWRFSELLRLLAGRSGG